MNDEELIRRIIDRDGTAMTYIVEKYSRLLWKVASGVLYSKGSESDAEECIADVYVYLWERPNAFDHTKGSLKSWLCMTARCKAIDRYRVLSRNNAISIDTVAEAAIDGVEAAFLNNEALNELNLCLEQLEDVEREIFLRRYVDGQKPKAIAKSFGVSVKHINNSLYRTKQKLKEKLKGEQL